MSYNLTLTNGTALLTLDDGTADTTTTSVNLVGRNYAGYGTFLNENFIKMLEHFSSATAPSNPLVGQLWWDSTSRHLNVWQGTNWKVISSSLTGSTAPVNPVAGDFWWNTITSQFSVYNGTSWITIGPATPPGAAVTAITANSVSDGTNLHTVGNIIVNNKLSAIFSSDSSSFVPVSSSYSVINPGLNLLTSITAGGNITAGGAATITGNLSANNLTGATVNVAGNTTVGGTLIGNGATFSGNVSFTGNISYPPMANQIFSSNMLPSANLTYNLGSPTVWWNNIYGTSIHAQYADLAERFETDVAYAPGTVVELGGAAEITAVVEELSEEVFGVISSKAAFVMNGRAGDDFTHPPVAVQGRVPVKVVGKVRKGQRLVSAGNGLARAGTKQEITTWNVIGRSLENKTTDGEGVIEAVVKLNS